MGGNKIEYLKTIPIYFSNSKEIYGLGFYLIENIYFF